MIRPGPFAGALLALFLVSASQAASEIEAWPCYGCSEIQFQSAAASRGPGRHYLYDFGTSKLRGFEVTREADLIPGAIVFIAEQFEIDLALRESFARLSQVRAELGDLSKIVVELSASPSDPIAQHLAYDVAVASAARNDISDWLRSRANELFARAGMSLATAGNLGGLLQALDKVLTQGELLKVTINITLVDGSKVVFEFSRSNLVEGAPEYIPGSARDVNNNSILEPGQTPAGGEQFRFPIDNSEGEVQRWLDHTCSIVRCLRPDRVGGLRACVFTGGEIRCVTVP
jgi:hypothetical protein